MRQAKMGLARTLGVVSLATVCVGAGLASGCQSPLANHRRASDEPTPQAAETPAAPAAPAATDCPLRFAQTELCARLDWDAPPNAQDEATFKLRFWRGSAPASYVRPDYTVKVELFMPSMGHGSSPIDLQPLDDHYVGTRAYFIMPGEWQVRVQLSDQAREVDADAFTIAIE